MRLPCAGIGHNLQDIADAQVGVSHLSLFIGKLRLVHRLGGVTLRGKSGGLTPAHIIFSRGRLRKSGCGGKKRRGGEISMLPSLPL